MQNISIKVDQNQEGALVKTNSPTFFKKICKKNEFQECGIYYTAKATISLMSEGTNAPSFSVVKKVDREEYVPFLAPLNAVKEYKEIQKVLAIEDIDRQLVEKGMLSYIDENILTKNYACLGLAGLMWLATGGDVKATSIYGIIAVLAQFNLVEAYKLAKNLLMTEQEKKGARVSLSSTAIGSAGTEIPKKDDVYLYVHTTW